MRCSVWVWVAVIKLSLCAQNADSVEGIIKPKQVSDEEGGELSKEVCGGVVKLEQSKYVISKKDQDADWIHMSQQSAWGRHNQHKYGQTELRRWETQHVFDTQPHLRNGNLAPSPWELSRAALKPS